MRKYSSFLVAAGLLLGCSDDGSKTTAPRLSGAVVGGASLEKGGNNGNNGNSGNNGNDDHGNHGGARLAVTLLEGKNEVPPHDTPANGQVFVRLSKDGQSMDYTLIVNNIKNVTQAHFHMAARGVNGPIVVWMYPSSKATAALPGGSGPVTKLVVEGTFTAADFRNALAGKTMADFIAAIRAGNIYGNVHTDDGNAATVNSGPGDFPGGEIRGQLDKKDNFEH
jgi:hypothetical protein